MTMRLELGEVVVGRCSPPLEPNCILIVPLRCKLCQSGHSYVRMIDCSGRLPPNKTAWIGEFMAAKVANFNIT